MSGRAMRHAVWVGVALIPVAVVYWLASHSPRPSGLGLSRGKLSPCPASPNCVCSEVSDEPHSVAPLEFKGTPPEAEKKLRQAVLGMRNTTLIEAKNGYLSAEFRSTFFRFVDDVEFSIEPEAKRIQVRSASRVGRSDLGVNRRRIEEIRRRFSELQP